MHEPWYVPTCKHWHKVKNDATPGALYLNYAWREFYDHYMWAFCPICGGAAIDEYAPK